MVRGGIARAVLALVTAGALVAAAGMAHGRPAAAAGAGYWHASGNQVLDANNQPVRIAGINWYGFETSDAVVHGLWAQDYHTIVDDIRNLGYNVIRIPLSNQTVESNPVPSNLSFFGSSGPINTDLKGLTSLQILDRIVAYAGQDGLRIILDNHRSEAGNSAEQNGLWYTSAYPQSAWANDWLTLVRRYQGNTTVVGVDLRNEPHTPAGVPYAQGATWGTGDPTTDWRLAAQNVGNQILAVNPHLLICVEGISNFPNSSGGFDTDWWGGNLEGAASFPVQLSVPGQLVYSAHDYGPNLFQQAWFNSGTTFQSLVGVWTKYWAYLYANQTAPVWVGEFGTTNSAADVSSSAPGSQGQWFASMVRFLTGNPAMGWTYWALNGEDAYALLDNSYSATPVSAQKQQALAGIQSPLSASPTPTPSGPTPTPGGTVSLQVEYANGDTNATDSSQHPHFQVVNTGSTPIDLSRLTLRYWYTINDPSTPSVAETFSCDYAALGCGSVSGAFTQLTTPRTGADHYMTVAFGSGSLGPGGVSGEIQTRFAKSDWSAFDGANDYSWSTATGYAPWSHVTAYYQGQLVWGTEP